jgi:DNA (cytosine-5)-methyltransferase 1
VNRFTFSDCFAGVGGLRLAGEAAGGTCVFSSEIDCACREVYEANHGEVPSGDLALADPRRVPPHDLCLASPPCTPFSQSGHRNGLSDERANVLYSLFRFLAGVRPKVILIENVRGLATNDGGRPLRFVLRTLRGLGYRVSWAVLPATRFGGCQLRRRLFVVASLGRRFRFGLLPRLSAGGMSDILEPAVTEGWLRADEYTLLEEPVARASGMQGLPDTFRWVRPERAVMQVGNSVHVPTVAAIVRGIAEQLLSAPSKKEVAR